MKHAKKSAKVIVFIFSAVFLIASFPMKAFATQTRVQYFNQNYTLESQGADNIVKVAMAQMGKKGSDLKYTEEWCADFVSDCALLAEEGQAIPKNGSVGALCDGIIRNGGHIVSGIPQKGDIAVYDWSGNKKRNHVEIVYNVDGERVYTVGGNSGSSSSLSGRAVKSHTYIYNASVFTYFVRPDYRNRSVNQDTEGPAITEVTAQARSQDTGKISFRAADISGISSTAVTVWTDKNGTDDIKTYECTRVSGTETDGYYECYIYNVDHNSEHGLYHVNIQCTDKRNNHSNTSTGLTLPEKAPSITVSEITPTDTGYHLTFEVLFSTTTKELYTAECKEVCTWTEYLGTDDMISERPLVKRKISSSGGSTPDYSIIRCTITYEIDISVADHNKEAGTYFSKIVVTDSNENTFEYLVEAKVDESIPDNIEEKIQYGDPQFVWAADYKTCKVTYPCLTEAAYSQTYDCTVTSKVKVKPACTQKGITTYTAVYGTDSDTRDVKDIEALGHKEKTTVRRATQSASGYEKVTCSVCSKVVKKTTIPKIKSVSVNDCTYTGRGVSPKITVKDANGDTIGKKYYSVSLRNHKKVGKATVAITFKGKYKGTATKSFKIIPKPTKVSKITAQSKALKVYWQKKTSQTTGYQIECATDSKFTNNVVKKTVSDRTRSSVRISGLKAKRKYYIRIRTYKTVSGKKYYSGWRTYTKTVTTK